MAPGERRRSLSVSASGAADLASFCCVLALVLLLVSLAGSRSGEQEQEQQPSHRDRGGLVVVARGARLGQATRACEELYVVAEGETLHSISARCGDPYILEHNPHVHDPDDVFPGLVIKITPRAAGNSPNGGGRPK